MEIHHDLSSYVQCEDGGKIIAALQNVFADLGLEPVDTAAGTVPDVASSDCNVVRVAVIPARQGWSLLLCAPEALLCEIGSNEKAHFVTLCDALDAKGFLREAEESEDYVGCMGEIELLADGQGNWALNGSWCNFNDEENPEWHGHLRASTSKDKAAKLLQAIGAAKPSGSEPVSDNESGLDIALSSCTVLEQMAPQALSCYWRNDRDAWELLKTYLSEGEPVPVEGALMLTLRRTNADRIWPKVVLPTVAQQPDFLYGDGQSLQIGDRVRLDNGKEGIVCNLLFTANPLDIWPRYAVVDIDGVSRMIQPRYIDRKRIFSNLLLLNTAGEPGTKPGVDELERRAEAKDVNAMVQLGFIYYVGDGQADSAARSCKWLKLATKNAHPDACYQLAEHHRAEYGVEFNWEKIRALAETAYRLGSVEAAETLIDFTSRPALLDLLREMANEGSEIAQYKLAQRLLAGDGVTQNTQEAARLFELAAEQGCGSAQMEIGKCYDNGIGVAQDVTRVAYWYSRSVDNRYTGAYPLLAKFLAEGRGVEKDIDRAISLLEKAQSEGVSGAREALAALRGR